MSAGRPSAVTVVLAGLAISGWAAFIFGGDRPPVDDAPRPTTVAESAPAAEPAGRPPAGPAGCPPPVATTAQCRRFVNEARALRGALDRARGRLAALEQEVEALDPVRRFPADLPAQYAEAGFTERLLRAVRETELDGDVDTIDCTAYPCIAVGTLPDRANLDRLMEHPAMRAFTDGGRSSGFGTGPGGQPLFYMALYPLGEGPAVGDDVSARFSRLITDRYAIPGGEE